ncbi:MAG: MFS transporter, partial [Rhodospirillaceae bacterium]
GNSGVANTSSTGFAEAISLPASFYLFACLNLLGAIMALVLIGAKSERMPERVGPPVEAWKKHFANPKLRSSFAIGFLILFVFVGVFTYVNFELVGPALGVSPALLGLVYFVFVPAMVTTPMAPKVVARFGMRRVFWAASLLAVLGIGLSATTSLVAVLVGLALIGVGTFGAQAATTAFVGRTAQFSHAAANGLYLTSYYVGGLVGAFALGMVYDMAGWVAVAAITAVALLLACVLAVVMVDAKPVAAKDQAAAPAE